MLAIFVFLTQLDNVKAYYTASVDLQETTSNVIYDIK